MIAALLLVVLVLAAGCTSGPSDAPGRPANPDPGVPMGTNGAPVPALTWRACGGAFQCADVVVPLDYRRPTGGPTLTLAALRLPATDPGARIGTLAVDYGGPGTSGTASLRRLAKRFDGVRARMDVLAVDPRGVGASDPVRCGRFSGPDAAVPQPVGPARTPAFWASAAEPGRACLAGTGEALGHLSTANAARDLDLVRQALREETLSLYGYSYGTYSAATYANLFPTHTRATVLDGTLDVVANSTGAPGTERLPVDTRGGVAGAWEETFGAALDACAAAGPARCALAGTGDPRARATDVAAAAGPASAELVERIDTALQTSGRLPGLMRTLTARAATAPPSGGRIPPAAQPWAPAHSPSFLAVQCTDSATPSAADVDAALPGEQAAHPLFGASAALNTAMCVDWPAVDPDRYLGPWNAALAAPALIVNSRYDPATPLLDARATAAALSAARVLVVEGIGHTTLDVPSRCATDTFTAYLLDPTRLPAEDATCAADAVTFG